MSFQWSREGGELPVGRSHDSGFGLLVLTTVEEEDSGTYVCTVTAGIYSVMEKLELKVEDDMTTTTEAPFYSPDPYSYGRYSPPQRHYPELYRGPATERPQHQPSYRRYPYNPSPQQYQEHFGGRNQDPRDQPQCPSVDVRVEPSHLTVAQGEDAQLQCVADGGDHDGVQYRWEKVRDEMNQETTVISGPHLTISPVQVADRGLYVCTVASGCGSRARSSGVLEVEPREVPRVELYPDTRQTVNMGESVLFQCRTLSGIPPPSVNWYREDRRPMSDNVELLPGGVIRINEVSPEDGGAYICQASNIVGDATTTAIVHVLDSPSIPVVRLLPQGHITVQEHHPLNVTCHVSGGGNVSHVSWKRMNRDGQIHAANGNNLVFDRITIDDQDTYICSAINSGGSDQDTIDIQVISNHINKAQPYTDKRRLTPSPRNDNFPSSANDISVITTRGSNVDLNCAPLPHVRQMTEEDDIVWSRSDHVDIASRHIISRGKFEFFRLESLCATFKAHNHN